MLLLHMWKSKSQNDGVLEVEPLEVVGRRVKPSGWISGYRRQHQSHFSVY